MRRLVGGVFLFLLLVTSCRSILAAPKPKTVVLGAAHKVNYSKAGDPAGAAPGETELNIRALLVGGVLKEWTTGDPHDVTDRSFVVRRAIRLNDTLPGDQPAPDKHWVWQRGPWLMVDRATGHITALKLPDYNPEVSQVAWFRDYGAYCGVTASGKSLFAVVAQISARKPVLAKKIAAVESQSIGAQNVDAKDQAAPACAPTEWQREPLRVTFHPAGKDAVSYDIVPGSAVLIEDSGDAAETTDTPAAQKK
ncbi:MAG: hypothetical protein ABR928_12335 [Terracidiphilus sp.]|jgi:hypothetical protein